VWLYDLSPIDMWGGKFAAARVVGEVPCDPEERVCSICDYPLHRRRLGAYRICWTPGCDVIADFTWAMFYEPIVSDRVKVAFEANRITGYSAYRVEICKPAARKSRKLPMVPWPYTGPPFWDLHYTEHVHVIPDKSTLKEAGRCTQCGLQKYSTVGYQAQELDFVVDRRTWSGSDFMVPEEVMGYFVTERVVDVITSNNFTNVVVRRVGRMSD